MWRTREAIWLAVALVVIYMSLNAVIIGRELFDLAVHPERLGAWHANMFAQQSNPWMMIAVTLILFPKLALGLSGFETGVAVMPLVAGEGATPEDVDCINAHGTSTPKNDPVETAAIKRLLGPRAAQVPVCATKSMIGHLIAAAGAVEAIACVRALEEGVIPPTINYEHEDPACDLDYVPNEPREKRLAHAMNNSFGFGGQNIVTILRRA